MPDEQLARAYMAGRISRRARVRLLIGSGLSIAGASAFVDELAPAAFGAAGKPTPKKPTPKPTPGGPPPPPPPPPGPVGAGGGGPPCGPRDKLRATPPSVVR
jgi:hypothetical protein